MLHTHLLKKSTPITQECKEDRWKYFENCLGALHGTHISVQVPSEDRPKYRTRKGFIAMNVLGVCNPNSEFIYVQPGWEGSTHDGRVLQDAISRPNGLKVSQGAYYLVDAGYTNREGFLAPYRGLWNVPFPFFEQLAIVFGVDRITGLQSETFVEAIDNQEKETIELDKDGSDQDDEADDNESVNQSKQSTPSEPSSKKRKKEKTTKGQGRKRKTPEVVDLTSSFNNMS
ncbi:hypothetical protein BVRB_9g212180 [Beta vulgaris subsp. vulgaris]|nr:hypothetical protein BVRB_9g212180 [Beta vulgaris subsp. vulgaris]